MARHRKERQHAVTPEDLEKLDDALDEFAELFHRTIACVMPSKGNMIKFHKLNHVTSELM